MNKIILTMAMVASVGLAGCDTVAYSGQKEKIGAISGAVLGGVLGSNVGGGKGQLVATGIGVLVGTLVGSELGRSLDKADMVYASQANAQAHSAPIGNTISWNKLPPNLGALLKAGAFGAGPFGAGALGA